MKTIVRQWTSELTPSEFEVLLFINERTLRFGKTTENIPISHFVHGLQNKKTGEIIVSGLGIGRTAVKGAITTLTEKNLIIHEPQTERGRWTGGVFGIRTDTISERSTAHDLTIGKRRTGRRRSRRKPESE